MNADRKNLPRRHGDTEESHKKLPELPKLKAKILRTSELISFSKQMKGNKDKEFEMLGR